MSGREKVLWPGLIGGLPGWFDGVPLVQCESPLPFAAGMCMGSPAVAGFDDLATRGLEEGLHRVLSFLRARAPDKAHTIILFAPKTLIAEMHAQDNDFGTTIEGR